MPNNFIIILQCPQNLSFPTVKKCKCESIKSRNWHEPNTNYAKKRAHSHSNDFIYKKKVHAAHSFNWNTHFGCTCYEKESLHVFVAK